MNDQCRPGQYRRSGHCYDPAPPEVVRICKIITIASIIGLIIFMAIAIALGG